MSNLEIATWVLGVAALLSIVMLAIIVPGYNELRDDRDIFLELTDCELLKQYGLQFKHFTIRDYIMDACF